MKKNVIMVAATLAATSATGANANEVMNQAVSSAASLAAAVEANQAEQDILSKAPYYSKDANGNLFILRGADMLKSAENICKARRVYAMPVPEGMETTKELGVYKLRKDGKESVLDTWVLTFAGTAHYAQPIPQGWSSWGWMSKALSRTDVMGGMDFVSWATSHEYHAYNAQGNGFCYGTDINGHKVIIIYEA